MKLSVVIPARNEAAQIVDTLTALSGHFDEVELANFELVVVDDGSRDETRALVERLGDQDPRIRLVHNQGAHGFGRAVRLGLDHYTGDAVVIYMADASDSPADVVRYYEILRDEAECAFGSRFAAGSNIHNYPKFKLAMNRAANMLIRLLFGLKYNDVTNAFKGYRRYVIDGCRPFVSPHFNLTIELPLKAIVRGYTFRSPPISWRNRSSGASQLLLQEQGSRYLFVLLTVWFEWLLVRSDYSRPTSESFRRWDSAADDPSTSDRRNGGSEGKP
jgi:dolichol-phosphate mannosyltransferase